MPQRTRNLADAIRRKLAQDVDLAAAVRRERFNFNVAEELLRIREEAGLTQKQLADRAGTHQSVIARLEDADYDGHSLRMLERIADAVGKSVEIRFVSGCDKPGGSQFATNQPAKRNRPARKKA